jgi:flavin reductase (DIM6/NTAB) family NADH-FMN oxidoreductase RutF
MPFDSRRFRDALAHFPTGVVVATTLAPNGRRMGMTMSSFNSVSLDPPLVLFSMQRRAHSFAAWQQASRYAINILNQEQEALSNRFARAMDDKWDGIAPLTGSTGVPILPNALVAFECEAHARYDGGDHEIFLGRVVDIHESSFTQGRPLVFFDGRYRQLASVAHAPPDEAVLLHGW